MKAIVKKRILQAVSAMLLLIFLCSCLSSCATRALPSAKGDLRVVGTVGEYEVLYEELRFLTLLHKDSLASRYGVNIWKNEEDTAKYLPELERLVYEDILANYAVLSLGAKEGYSIDDYAKDVQTYIDQIMELDFDGSRAYYKEMLKVNSLTDHYLRFTAGVDAIFEELYYHYLENGTISDDKADVKQYILDNFVYVSSICLINKNGEEYELNRDRAEQYRKEVANGANIKDYIKYTLDLSPEHCFTRGEMDTVYEEHAFALENVGDVSEVFLADATYLGETRTAWYFMQKLALKESYVNENYDDLFDQYATAIINDMLEEEKKDLSFTPNEYGKSIDLLAIEPIERVADNTWIFVLLGAVVAGGLVFGGVMIFRVLNRTDAKNSSTASKESKKSESTKKK